MIVEIRSRAERGRASNTNPKGGIDTRLSPGGGYNWSDQRLLSDRVQH